MRLLSLEHGNAAYRFDFIFYAAAILMLSVYLAKVTPHEQYVSLAVLALAGLVAWTLIEYLLHRFVLHRLQPFHRWHLEHHSRQSALICTPTMLSASLVVILVFLPALLSSDLIQACALTLGLLVGYFGYALAHHAIHHWHAKSAWMRRRKHWHAVHHHTSQHCRYGVTNEFWDVVFRTTKSR